MGIDDEIARGELGNANLAAEVVRLKETHERAMRQIGALLDLPAGVTDLSIITNAIIAMRTTHRVLRQRVGDP